MPQPVAPILETLDRRRAELESAVTESGIDAVAAFQAIDGLTDDTAVMGRSLATILTKGYGWTWQDVGDSLGISRQAAWERYHDVERPQRRKERSTAGRDRNEHLRPVHDQPAETMRRFALDAIENATRGPARRWERSRMYITANEKCIHLRTRRRDEQEGGWVRYWFGIQDDCWQDATDFFVLVCDVDFVLVIPVSEWLPYMERFSVSNRGKPTQSRQPHIYWRGDVYELRERLREHDPPNPRRCAMGEQVRPSEVAERSPVRRQLGAHSRTCNYNTATFVPTGAQNAPS